jgi:hypothetical protein
MNEASANAAKGFGVGMCLTLAFESAVWSLMELNSGDWIMSIVLGLVAVGLFFGGSAFANLDVKEDGL